MSESTPDATPEASVASSNPPPRTGHPLIDAALQEFGTLTDHPVETHHERLAQVQEVLAGVLEQRGQAQQGTQTSIPGTVNPVPGAREPGPRGPGIPGAASRPAGPGPRPGPGPR